ncbi:MAG: reverse transcriptase-like protein [Bacteroidales bacterium]
MKADVRPVCGICCDAAHSTKNGVTEYQCVDLITNERLYYRNLGNQTVNIGEFLAIIECIKHIIETDYKHKVIYSDSITALTWIKNKKTASKKKNSELKKAEVFLKVNAYLIDEIEFYHWDNANWGEIPADFGNK